MTRRKLLGLLAWLPLIGKWARARAEALSTVTSLRMADYERVRPLLPDIFTPLDPATLPPPDPQPDLGDEPYPPSKEEKADEPSE